MKRVTLLSIIGLGIAATHVHGQGSIVFNTYVANNGNGILVTYGAGWLGPPIGTPIDNTFTGVLLYSATPINDTATTFLGSQWLQLNPNLIVGSVGTFATPSTVPNGYIEAPNLNISASIGQTLYFEVAAYNGSSYGTSAWAGHSASFTATLVTGTTVPTPDQLNNLQPFQVWGPVPEPTTFALGGLGLASLLLFRRKQA
jgi:hypothetical protein